MPGSVGSAALQGPGMGMTGDSNELIGDVVDKVPCHDQYPIVRGPETFGPWFADGRANNGRSSLPPKDRRVHLPRIDARQTSSACNTTRSVRTPSDASGSVSQATAALAMSSTGWAKVVRL